MRGRKRSWWDEPAVPMGIGPSLTNGGCLAPLLLIGAVLLYFLLVGPFGHWIVGAALMGWLLYWGWGKLTGGTMRWGGKAELARQKAEYERRHGRPYPYGDRLYYSGR